MKSPALVPLGAFGATVVRRVNWPGFRATVCAYAPHSYLPWHRHEQAYLGINLAGNFTQAWDRGMRNASPWAVSFHPAGQAHENTFSSSGAYCLNIEISPERLERLRLHCDWLDGPRHASGGAPVWLGARIYSELTRGGVGSQLAVEGLLFEMVAELGRLSQGGAQIPPWLRCANEIIEAGFTHNLTLSGIAAAVGVHQVHLAREFRRRFGLSVGERIRKLRVEVACRRLADSSQPLAAIGLQVGFSDQSQFSRIFRRIVGRSPREFRAAAFTPPDMLPARIPVPPS